jgi:hypothetical protein
MGALTGPDQLLERGDQVEAEAGSPAISPFGSMASCCAPESGLQTWRVRV